MQLLHENGNVEIELNHPKAIGLAGPKTLDPITGILKTDQFFLYLKMVSYLAKNIWSYKPLTQICIVPNCVNPLNFLFQANEIREAVDYKVIKLYFIKIC